MKPLKTDAIVLRRIEYGEADRIVTLLTSDRGKVRVIAKGVRKSKSKLAGGIELFSVSEIQYLKGKKDIGTLVSTRIRRNYGEIVKDLDRTEQAYFMLKAVDKLLEDETGEEYFDVLDDSLKALNTSNLPHVFAELSFKIRLLYQAGHVPDFSVDASGNKLDPEAKFAFDFESYTFRQDEKGNFDKNHLKVLKLITHNSPDKLVAVQGLGGYLEDLAPLIRSLSVQFIPV